MSTSHKRGVLGIDLGVTGALALLSSGGELEDVFDMPCLNDGPKGRRTINAPLFAELIHNSHASHAYVEAIGPRPGEGAVGAFAFGVCKGVIVGVLAAAGIPVLFMTPPQWKRVVGIKSGKEGAKDAARSQAISRWPAKAGLFKLVKDHGRAESALIGLAGILRFDSIATLSEETLKLL